MSYKKTLLTFIFLIGLVLSLMAFLSYQRNTTSIIANDDMPDAYMENVNAVIIDKTGNPSLKIVTPRVLHFSKNDTSEFIDPHLTLYRQSPEPWYIAAKFGRALNGINHVIFWDEVTMHHAADMQNPNTLIKTPKLTVNPKEQTAATDELITLIQPNLIIRAIGMSADLNAGNVKLLKEARGEYVPDA